VEAVDALAKNHLELISFSLDEQLSIFEISADRTISVIRSLYDNKFFIDYLTNDQLVKLFEAVSTTANNGCPLSKI
jgi:hypothetical protein